MTLPTLSFLRRGLLLLSVLLLVHSAGFATGAPLVCAPEVRRASAASDPVFRDVMNAPTGVGMTDEALYPHADNRQVVKIAVLSAYTGKNIGIEHWTVAHTETDSVIYLVRLVSDGRGGTIVAVGRDIAAETELAQPKPMSRADSDGLKALTFENTRYIRHWGAAERQLFTPAGQDSLPTASDVFVVGFYPSVSDDATLADLANRIVARYKETGAFVISARPIAGTETHPGECFISVVIQEGSTLIAEFARYQVSEGVGTVIAYQHRIHGAKASDAMHQWVRTNGGEKETDILAWEPTRPLSFFRN